MVALTLASCGGSDDPAPSSDSAGTPAATATATPTPTPDREADGRVARQSTLTLEDFPSGWTETPDDESNDSKCEQVEAAKAQTTARATSPRFSEGENTQVQNSIYVFADASTAEQAFAQVSGEETRLCYADTVTEALKGQTDLDVGETQSARLSLDPVGDQREAARLTVPLSAEGVDVDLVIDLVFVRADRGLSLSLFINVSAPFDADLREELTATSVTRLSDALGAG